MFLTQLHVHQRMNANGNWHQMIYFPETIIQWVQYSKEEERWLNGSAPDCKSVVLGSNPVPPQHTANSVSPEVGSHLGWHSTVCWPLRGGRGTYTQKTHKNIKEKKQWVQCYWGYLHTVFLLLCTLTLTLCIIASWSHEGVVFVSSQLTPTEGPGPPIPKMASPPTGSTHTSFPGSRTNSALEKRFFRLKFSNTEFSMPWWGIYF